MSRIDQALKRAGLDRDASHDNEQAFVSPWAKPVDEPLARKSTFQPERPAVQPSAPPLPAATPTLPPAPVEADAAAADLPLADAVTSSRLKAGSDAVISFSNKWRERLANSPEADSTLVEQFRRLAGTLHSSQSATRLRVLMVTSASPEDGKTITAINLALVLSESYRRRVLLIDADLRRPSLGRAAELTEAPGLSDALKAPADQKLSVLPLTPLLTLLPAGRPNPDPMGLLTSPRMRSILEEAAERFDWVILDAPPMGPMADANLLAEMADGAVFVVRAGRSKHAAVKKAVDALGRERLLGIVLNGVERMPRESYGTYGREASESA